MNSPNRRSAIKMLAASSVMLPAGGLPSTSPAAAKSGLPPDFLDIRALTGGDGDISAALRRAKALGRTAWIPSGKYNVSGRIDQGDMTIRAAPDASIVATGDDSVVFWSSGDFLKLPEATGTLSKGQTRIRLGGPHRLKPGDWIIIYNPADYSWHSSRPYYRAGEWCRVASASRRSITLSRPLRDEYAASNVQLFRVVLRRPAIIGGRWDCGGRELARYTACTGKLVDIERLDAASNTAIHIDRCVEADIRCRIGRNLGAGLDDYLISIGNSQFVRVEGERLYSRRHPVAIGGGDLVCGVPCRDCTVEDVALENDIASNVMCADIHGNVEDCAYIRCTVFGGISLGGANPSYRNCIVYARKDGTAAEATELVGGNINLTGLEITTDATHVGGGRGVIDIGTQNGAFNAGTRRVIALTIRDFSINAPHLARDEAIIRIRNAGSKARLDVRISHGKLTLNQPVQFLRTEFVSASDTSKTIDINDVVGLPEQSKLHYAVPASYGQSVRNPR